MPTRKKSSADYLFLIPAAVIYLSVIVLPVLYSLTISLFKWNGIGALEYIGLQNYVNLFSNDPIFVQAMKNNLIWIVLSLAITMTVSLAFAVVLNKQFTGRTFLSKAGSPALNTVYTRSFLLPCGSPRVNP
jgi:ABC-type sugar transport system permease subunit